MLIGKNLKNGKIDAFNCKSFAKNKIQLESNAIIINNETNANGSDGDDADDQHDGDDVDDNNDETNHKLNQF